MDKNELVTGDWHWQVDSDKIIITIDNSELKPPLEYMRRVAKLISAAPVMYELLCEVYISFPRDKDVMGKIRELLDSLNWK